MASSAIVPAATLANLQAAYDGECNARAKYTAFAVKAIAEGFRDVASLFRAAAARDRFMRRTMPLVNGPQQFAWREVRRSPIAADNVQLSFGRRGYEQTNLYRCL